MAIATVNDVAVSLGRLPADLSETETAQIEQWLADAELQITLRLGDLVDLDPAAVAFVEREAVVARMRNPEGRQYEAIDDYRYGMPAESRKVTILDEWWAMLAPSTGAFTIRPAYTPDDPASMAAWRAANP